MSFLLSRKGFLFTISLIFIVSTLVFFAQNYSAKSLAEQNSIIYSYKPTLLSYLSDDISKDLLSIVGLSISDSFTDSDLIVNISDSIQKNSNLVDSLNDYSTFLDSNYFSRIQGDESIDLSGATDGHFEANLGDNLVYTNNYGNTLVTLMNSSTGSLKSIDLNIFSEGDLNSYSFSSNSGSASITIRFFSDNNYFIETASIDPSQVSTLDIYHSNDPSDVTRVTVGEIDGVTDSISIDSNSLNQVSFSLVSSYYGYTSTVPIDLNILLSSNSPYINSSSLVRVQK